MELEQVKLQTTWNDAAGSINSNYAKIADAIAQLKANGGGGGGGADIDLTDYATKVWVEANYAPLTSIQGFENRIGGLEGAVPQLNNRVTTVESKVSSLNETVSTGKNNLLGRVNVIEEEYATKTYVDNAIDGIDLSPYLKTDDAEETYATKDFVDNKLVDYAPLTSVQGFENRIKGLEGAVPQLNNRVTTVESKVSTLNETVSTGKNNLLGRVNTIETDYVTSGDLESAINGIDLSAYLLKADLTKSRIQSTLGISDWALAAIKPSYAWSEITSRPTALSQFTDDVVAGKYLPLSGGTVVGEFAIKAGAANSATIRFSPNSGAINHWLGVNSAGVLLFSNNGWSQQYDILHSGNIGNYKSGDSAKLGGYDISRFLLMTGRDYTEMDLNTIGGSQSIFTEIRTTEVTTTNSPYEGYGALLSLKDRSGVAKMQFLGSYNSSVLYFRSQQKGGADITSDWKTIAFTDSNVASATKLETPHTLWGQSFDGTKDITLGLNLDGYKSTGTVSQISDLGDKGLVVSIDDKRNNYGMAFWVEGNCKGYIQQQAFGSSTTYSLCMQPFGGNVGIGTASPTERLDVSGNIKASGNINATSITINGVTITASNGSITVNGNVFATGDITGGV